MFTFHIAYSLELLVLAAGLGLIYFGTKQTSSLLKIGGYILSIITILNMVCTLSYGIRYWKEGRYGSNSDQSCPMHKGGESMMPGMMMPGMMDEETLKKIPTSMPMGPKTNDADHGHDADKP